MAYYLATVHEENGVFGVSFPDFPGCVTVGDTLAEAIANAKEALEFHMEGMEEDGDEIPEPSELSDVKNHEFAEGAVIVPVEANRPGKQTRINVSVGERDLAEIDSYAKRSGMTRSGFLVSAAMQVMAKDNNPSKRG